MLLVLGQDTKTGGNRSGIFSFLKFAESNQSGKRLGGGGEGRQEPQELDKKKRGVSYNLLNALGGRLGGYRLIARLFFFF